MIVEPLIWAKDKDIRLEDVIIGNIKARRVRIYMFDTFKAITDEENEIWHSDKSKLLGVICKNEKVREIPSKYLWEGNEIVVFENDITRLAFEDRGIKETDDIPLLDEIVYLKVHHNDIMWQIIRDGIRIDGKEYMLFSATTGQVRNTKVTLMRSDFFEKHRGYLMVGLSQERINSHTNAVKKEAGMNVGKYLAYNALPLSSSVLPDREIDIDRCIVVKGLETIVTNKVKYVDVRTDEKGQCYVADTPEDYVTMDIAIEHTDGAGMFLPGELPSSCQIRSGYFKGAMFPFDFKAFANEIAHNTVICDAWDNLVDIEKEDVRFVFTTSQLKMWKEFDSWEEYKNFFRENGLKVSINSYANPAKEYVNFAYQYLQTLPYGTDITPICELSVEDLKKLKEDAEYVKQELGFTDDAATDEDMDNDTKVELVKQEGQVANRKNSSVNSYIAKALDLYPPLVYDPYIKKKIQSMFNARKKAYMGGKLKMRGYYSYIVPDMYAFCEFLFMNDMDPEGVVPKGYVYNKYYDECGDVEDVICLRSPHLSRYEYPKRKLMKSEECRRWFGAMESDTVVSCHDLISKSLQCDWDGDEILITADKNLYQAASPLPKEPLYYEMQKAEAQTITKEAIYDTLVKGFDNNVIGESSNAITKLWNSPALKDDPLKYDDAINVFCAYSNYAIDFPKTGKNLALGEYEQLYKDLIPPHDIREKMKTPKVKYPQFFRFAKNKTTNLEEYTDSPMDCIAKYINEQTGRKHYKYFGVGEFDYRELMNNETDAEKKPLYEVNRADGKYVKLFEILHRRKNQKRAICEDIQAERRKCNVDSKEVTRKFDVFHYHCVREIKELFTDKDGKFNVNLAVNYMIDMEYNQHSLVNSSKDILWRCFGHVIIDNINQNQKTGITLKERPRMAYLKAVKENDAELEELDKNIAEKLQKKSVVITESDMEFMGKVLTTKKNGQYYKNDRELLFALLCHYKYGLQNNTLKENWLQITKKKHVTSKKNGRKKKVSVRYNVNVIMKMVGATSYAESFRRFKEKGTNLIQITGEGEGESSIRVKIDGLFQKADKVLFEVKDIYNPYVYFEAYEKRKKLTECVICGKDFIKSSNNQKTCTDKCMERLHKLNVSKNNEKLKNVG